VVGSDQENAISHLGERRVGDAQPGRRGPWRDCRIQIMAMRPGVAVFTIPTTRRSGNTNSLLSSSPSERGVIKTICVLPGRHPYLIYEIAFPNLTCKNRQPIPCQRSLDDVKQDCRWFTDPEPQPRP
jgi:hypothetical protein